ncbi:UNVERIFIED_CONTAM: hypothetical protein Scaly_1670400 [Sesamum calycinum]|uniref:Uncharacterized protein n=1 Tax=Sesamum calycinum TaxID=2727403 RepID=A0AAW2NSN7_9LAMI
MLHLFFAVAFSAAPLILYVPPIRSLNLFLEAVQDMWRETSGHTVRVYPRLSLSCPRKVPSYHRLRISVPVMAVNHYFTAQQLAAMSGALGLPVTVPSELWDASAIRDDPLRRGAAPRSTREKVQSTKPETPLMSRARPLPP